MEKNKINKINKVNKKYENIVLQNKIKKLKEFNDILNVLSEDKNSINLLYSLIKRIFKNEENNSKYFLKIKSEEKISEIQKTFETSLQKNVENNDYDTLLKIAKAVYRIKLDQHLNNLNQESFAEIKNILKKTTITNKNRINTFSRLSSLAIPKAANNLEAFHNFNSIQYFIYKKEIIDGHERVLKDSRGKIDLNKLLEMAPLYYQNGLLFINPKIKEKWVEQKSSIAKIIKKNPKMQNKNSEVEKLTTEEKENAEKINIEDLINLIDLFNNTKLLTKFFEKHIIEYNFEHNNNNSFINENMFNKFCELFGNYIDTIAIYKDGIKIREYSKPINTTNITKIQKGGDFLVDDLFFAFLECASEIDWEQVGSPRICRKSWSSCSCNICRIFLYNSCSWHSIFLFII